MTSTSSRENHVDDFIAKMLDAGQPELVVNHFARHYKQLLEGATGYIDRNEALPVKSLRSYDELGMGCTDVGVRALPKVAIAKLNGGLGTSMGMSGPKSLLPVKDGLTFLDIILRQVMHARKEYESSVPLLLMNSFNTHEATLDALKVYPDFVQDVPVDFVQHMKPKIWVDTLEPATWPQDPEKEWCPPGHGDIYVSLATSGVLQQLLEAGYEYLFVSNSDNLGAVLDPTILGYMVGLDVPFLMEVARRTEADVKGGHLSMRPDGQLILRESSQCPPDEIELFQDITCYRYFNTNNLWLHLPSVDRMLREEGVLNLPLILNEKPIDPAQPDSPHVYQLETAMGSAIALFEGAQALCVPRSRFVPVKQNSDLLILWSDAYIFNDDYQIVLNPKRTTEPRDEPPLVRLDPEYYTLIDDLQSRFPYGAPSLVNCRRLDIIGDHRFGKHITIVGDVRLNNTDIEPVTVQDDVTLSSSE